MKPKSLLVVAVAACCALVGLPPTSGGAAASDPPIEQVANTANGEDLLEAFSVLRPLSVAAEREQHSSPATFLDPASRQSEFCYFESFSDTIGDALFFDIDTYGIASDCTNWGFFVDTFDVEELEDLELFAALIDTDLRADTGCLGFDIWIAGFFDAGRGLLADTFARPSCDADLTRIADAGFSRSDDGALLALIVDEALLPSARPFGYALVTASVFGDLDRAPDEGVRVVSPVPVPVPGAPTGLRAQPGARRIAVQWQPPAAGGVVSYRATASPGGRSCTTTGTRCTISGLRNYTRYQISVVAINGRGSSAATRSANVVPRPPRTCAGRRVTVDLRAGDRPTSGADVILGTSRSERIRAGAGDDVICAGGGNDIIFGGPGNDIIFGEGGNDRIFGGPGNDRIDGGPGNDRCSGGPGRDRIRNCS